MSLGPAVPGFETFTRERWAAVGQGSAATSPAGDARAEEAAGAEVAEVPPDELAEVPPDELAEVYRPLCRLLRVVASDRRGGELRVAELLDLGGRPPPFVIGVAGSVAVGKSRVARVLQSLLARDPGVGPVEVLSTDAFLYPNGELAARGLSARKGFPESYDWPRLMAALAAIRSGDGEVDVPVYSHRDYDIVPGRHHRICRPSTVIVEGLNVLQIGPDDTRSPGGNAVVSDFVDWSIYVDAAEEDIVRWHSERLLGLRRTGAEHPGGFLGWFSSLSEDEAQAVAHGAWADINVVNLREHIAPSRVRARMILHMGADHRVSHVLVRTG